MNNFNFEAMMEHGFLIIPKALLQQQIEDPNIEAGEIEALLKILMKVNYSDTSLLTPTIKSKTARTKRKMIMHK